MFMKVGKYVQDYYFYNACAYIPGSIKYGQQKKNDFIKFDELISLLYIDAPTWNIKQNNFSSLGN